MERTKQHFLIKEKRLWKRFVKHPYQLLFRSKSMAEQSADIFDAYAKEYHAILSQSIRMTGAKSEYFSEYKVLVVKEHIAISTGSILDFGCGDGTTAFFFRKHFKQYKISGIDVSKESIAIAAKKGIPDSEFKLFNGKEIPFPGNTFSVLYIANVLHHTERKDRDVILQECFRVLQHNGTIFIFEHNPINPFTRKIVKECIFDKDAMLVMPDNLKNLLSSSGYKNIKISYHLFFPRHKIFRMFLSLEKNLKSIPLGGQYCITALKM